MTQQPHLCRWSSLVRRSCRFVVVIVVVVGAMTTVEATSEVVSANVQREPNVSTSPRVFLDRYCVGCHNDRLLTGGLTLDASSVDVANPFAAVGVWERVIAKLRAGTMPPAGRPRANEATYRSIAGQLERQIDQVALVNPNPGRTNPVHRLNRTEYQNAIRDLLALDLDVTDLLPGDETSDTGFDNNADVLSISTAQLERYLSAARTITRLATGLEPTGAGFETFDVPLLLKQDERQSEDLPLGSRGGVAIRHFFPVDGEYLIKIQLRTNWQDYILGMGTSHQLDVRIDDALVQRFSVGGEAKGRPAPVTFTIAESGDPSWETYLHEADDQLEVRVSVEAGPRVVGVSFIRNLWEPEGILLPEQAGELLSNDEVYYGNAAVSVVSIGGPYDITGTGDTPSQQEIFSCRPNLAAEDEPCAVEILSRLARRAYRRPMTATDLEILLDFFRRGRESGKTFESGIQLALERMLVDPDFLLRIERDPVGVTFESPYRLSDQEIASRLSFFLWASIPDESLINAAERGALTDSSVLEQQVRRMLLDERSQSLVDDFAAQWLHLRNLEDVQGDPVPFPDFDDNLVEAFKQETTLFLSRNLSEDRSVLELLDSDYTFVNERLARHYGIPGVYGTRFRRIQLPDRMRRGGLLGHGSLLALTSYPTRTSPVLRGKWLLDTLLGAPPPSPPPDVPALPARGDNGMTTSVRERLERHRSAPACAVCHSAIDPPGFALENFDGLGAWRTADEFGNPIDARATMPNGDVVQGFSGLRAFLMARPEQFAMTVTEKLLAYAIGRGLEFSDKSTVREIVRNAGSSNYQWSSLVLGVVNSPAFLMRMPG